MAVILDGKATSAQVRGEIATAARALTERTGVVPGLAVVIVGDDPASQVYVRNKRRACEQVGFYSEGFELPADPCRAIWTPGASCSASVRTRTWMPSIPTMSAGF